MRCAKRLPARNDRAEFDQRIDLVRRYVAFREDGKDFLMLGYDLLRDLALEAGRRLEDRARRISSSRARICSTRFASALRRTI